MDGERGADWDGFGPEDGDDPVDDAPAPYRSLLHSPTPVPFEPARRLPGAGPYLRAIRRSRSDHADGWPSGEFPFSVAALAELHEVSFDAPVTLLAGDNGTGKSTIVELIADVMAFAPEGGELVRSGALPPKPRGVLGDADLPDHASPDQSEPPLPDRMEPVLSATHPANGYFLRAESFFNVAEFIDGGSRYAPDLSLYGGVELHGQSHGQSFLALAANRFGPSGFYLLDEPEAALSLSGCLALVAIITRAARAGAQFIVATHSPVLLACPDAVIYELDEDGISPSSWESLDVVRTTRAFLDAPERFIDAALDGLD